MSRLRVMFIDDEPNVLAGLRRMLRGQRDEWEMSFANSGEEGLALMAGNPVDVLVCDMRMPSMNGVQVLAAVRERHPATARIILTGQTDRESVIAALTLTQRFLLKPCRAEDLIAAIHQVVDVRAAVDADQIQSFLGSVNSLPRPPSIYTRIVEVASRPDCEVDDLVRVVQDDIATTAEVLKLVNSGVFCTPHPVETLDEAIVLLGFDSIQALALASSAYRSEAPMPAGFDPEALARRGLLTATLCKRIAQVEGAGRGGISEVFLAGLLHEVGLLVQVAGAPAGWERVRDTPEGSWERVEAEVATFGCSATQASAYLLGLWGFAEPIVDAVLAQPVRAGVPEGNPAACVLAYARARGASPRQPLDPTPGGYLTADRLARWDDACDDLLRGLEPAH